MTERAVLLEQAFAARASAAHLGVQHAAAEPVPDAALVLAAVPVASRDGPEELAALEQAEHDAREPVAPASFAGAQDAASELPGSVDLGGFGGLRASGAAVREEQVAFSSERPASPDSRVAHIAVLLTALSLVDVH